MCGTHKICANNILPILENHENLEKKWHQMNLDVRLQELNKRFTKLSAGETLLVRLTARAVVNGTAKCTPVLPPAEELKGLLPLMTGAEKELYRAVLDVLQTSLTSDTSVPRRKSGYSLRSRSIHPPVKDEQGSVLANNPSEFARKHGLKYSGMLNGIDALTAARDLSGDDLPYHFEVIKYDKDGIIIRKTAGHGYRTYSDEVDEWRRIEGLPPIKRPKQKIQSVFE
ncbi:hypothetical protein Dform_00502 [Dehalogenimonas formicexedens]|uniref:Uncharacterized protein n=3 Tax=Dehalococcoidaceae TaxID=1202464 RepID=A0A1P8F5U7_9CHLR|nr:hypothetical protein Dform_00502 [Dehalogenimonas formicexedens]KTB49326.1 hypothetical protein DEALK_02390 [Dehalogenimonas alkenigignens]